jgi:hypothetical protein
MKYILFSISFILLFQAYLLANVFDSKKIPISVRLGVVHELDSSSLYAQSYPPITFEDLDRGLYVIPNALEANFSTLTSWKLFLKIGEQYHKDFSVGAYPQRKILWRIAHTNDPFTELLNQKDNLIKEGSSAQSDMSTILDLAFEIDWSTPPNFRYSFPFTFSIHEGTHP